MKRLAALAIAACVLGLGLATPAAAEETREQRISAAHLNLDSDAGAGAALGRIEHAARAACGARNGRMTLIDRQMQRQCISGKAERAVARLNRPVVTALYYNRRPTIFVS